MTRAAILLPLALAACGHDGKTTIETVVQVPTLVAQPCAGPRPAAVKPLREQLTTAQWSALDAKQKAAWIGKQAFDHKAYGENLGAATAACPTAGG